jgi:hypothetical protein
MMETIQILCTKAKRHRVVSVPCWQRGEPIDTRYKDCVAKARVGDFLPGQTEVKDQSVINCGAKPAETK